MNRWKGYSIATRLSLGIGGILLVALGTMAVLQFRELRGTLVVVGTERVDRAAYQLAELLGNSARQRTNAIARLAADSALLAALRSPGRGESAAAALESYPRSGAAAVELWNAAHERVAVAGEALPALEPPVAETLMKALSAGVPRAAVGPYHAVGDVPAYEVAASVLDGDELIGYVVSRHHVTNSPDAIAQITGLIGPDIGLLVGNRSGSMWTDLVEVVNAPPAESIDESDVFEYRREDGRVVMARALPIAATPWLLLVEMPRGPVLAPAGQYLVRAGFLSVLLVLAASGLGWMLVRRTTAPLADLTEATAAIAAGGEMRTVPVQGADEIARLAAAFNMMSEQIEAGRQQLEDRIARRTSELQEANARLEVTNAQLEAANGELEAFSYSVSHDLRAPLRAVDGFAAVLMEDHGPELTEDARRCLDMIRGGAQQMGQLIDDLLALSRVGRQAIAPAPVDMDQLAREVVEEACRQQGRDAAEVDVGPLAPALGERVLLRQVLANYVANALKFTRGRSAPRIEIGCENRDGEVTYYVRDNGVGFDIRYADKLFGVFQRLHAAEDFEGTGVGLAIVQRIVHRHGGRVHAVGETGEGATFQFTVPSAG